MRIIVDIKGLDKIARRLDKIYQIIPKLRAVMLEIVLKVQNDAKDFVTGRMALTKYQKEAAIEHKSTRIGNESLGVMTNRLRSSINGSIEEITKEFISVIVGTNVEYALIHEIGGTIVTKHANIQMPARPYLYASLLKNKDYITEKLYKAVRRLL